MVLGETKPPNLPYYLIASMSNTISIKMNEIAINPIIILQTVRPPNLYKWRFKILTVGAI